MDLSTKVRHPLTGEMQTRWCYDDGINPATWRVDVPGTKTVFVCDQHRGQWLTLKGAKARRLT